MVSIDNQVASTTPSKCEFCISADDVRQLLGRTICGECLSERSLLDVANRPDGVIEEQSLGFLTAMGSILWTWLFLAGVMALGLVAAVNVVWIAGIMGGLMPMLDPIDWIRASAFFGGFSFCFVSIAALPIALFSVPSGFGRRIRVDGHNIFVARLFGERSIDCAKLVWRRTRYFAPAGIAFCLPNRERIGVWENGSEKNRFAIAVGHTDASFDLWVRLLEFSAIEEAPPTQLLHYSRIGLVVRHVSIFG